MVGYAVENHKSIHVGSYIRLALKDKYRSRYNFFISRILIYGTNICVIRTFGLSFLPPALHLIILTSFRHFRNLRDDFSDFWWEFCFQVCMD